jgi:hypothetical protein
LSVESFGDARVTFSTEPDGTGQNFEVRFGVEGNTRSELYVNGVLIQSVSTPGILRPGFFVDFNISWVGGIIFVTQQNTIFIHQLTNPIAYRFIGTTTK